MGWLPEKDRVRFWRKVRLAAPDECWEWQASRYGSGYGEFRVGTGTKANGEIPPGAFICHHCDNRACCNPLHLYVGDAATNSADRSARGRARGASGENHGHSKLTVEQVAEIRAAAPHGRFPRGVRKALARKYGVSGMTIFQIASGRTWKEVKP